MPTPVMTLAVVFGGPSSEHEISIRSARTVIEALNPARYDVRLVGITREGGWLSEAASRRLLNGDDPGEQGTEPRLPDGTDCVFPVLHGPYGEDGLVQAWLQLCGVPCVGSDALSSQLAMDKVVTKLILRGNGVPVVNWTDLDRSQWMAHREEVLMACERHGYPLFVKPNRQGSSIGMSRVEDRTTLIQAIDLALQHDEVVLVEPELPGREFEIAVLDGSDFVVSEPGEIVLEGWYDFDAKYVNQEAKLVAPVEDLHPAVTWQLQQIAGKCFRLLRMKGMARVDFRMLDKQIGYESAGRLYVNEVNSIPGFTSISMYPRLLELAGYGLPHLIDELVQAAVRTNEPKGTSQDVRTTA